MSIERIIAEEVKKSGMTTAFICRKTGIKPGALYPALAERRELRADEFLALCQILNLDPREIAERSA